MSNYDNSNRGAIWPNRQREKDTHPHFTGSLNVDGKEYWVSAWKKDADAKEGAPSLSFSVKPKEGQPAQSPTQSPAGFDEDMIPF